MFAYLKLNTKKTRLSYLILILLKISALSVFLGRAWQHLFWDAPFRALLWDKDWVGWFVSGILGLDWQSYVTSGEGDQFIQYLIKGVGGIYFLAALAVLAYRNWPRLSRFLIFFGGINLILLAGLYAKEHFFYLAQFFEYSLQFSAPFFLLIYWRRKKVSKSMLMALKTGVAITFTCHGLFAIGIYPRPGPFIQMLISILGITEAQAIQFLNVAGIMDFVISIALFLPRRMTILASAYAVAWGFATTMARIVAHFHFEFWEYSLHRWVHESLFRFPHFLIPLLLFLYLSAKSKPD